MDTVENVRCAQQEELRRWLNENSAPALFFKLREKILGQDEELRKAAILVYSFIKTMESGRTAPKFHFLVEGKSGCGKTTFANALSELLPCPVLTVDASQLTPAGYKGADVGDFLTSEELERWWGCGVIVLDELDKLMEPVSSSDGNFHRQGLENLLKMLDGGTVVNRQGETVNCDRLLVIGMGAFSPLKQEHEERPIGFAAETPEASRDDISKESMTDFCGSEQFLGRFMTVLHFKPLSRKLYKKIVDQTVAEITALYGNFLFPVGEKSRIIDQAMSSEFGCRSVKSAVWEVFLNLDTVISKTNLDLLLAVRNAEI